MFLITGVALLAACGEARKPVIAIAGEKPSAPQVFLGVRSGKLEILPDTNTECWDSKPRKGCIIVKKRKTVRAHFFLRGDCEGCDKNWVFSRLQICPGKNKPASGACALKPLQRLEFGALRGKDSEILVPGADGEIDIKALGPAIAPAGADKTSIVDWFVVANQNATKTDYFYRIEACSTTSGACQWMDPRWTNKGRRG